MATSKSDFNMGSLFFQRLDSLISLSTESLLDLRANRVSSYSGGISDVISSFVSILTNISPFISKEDFNKIDFNIKGLNMYKKKVILLSNDPEWLEEVGIDSIYLDKMDEVLRMLLSAIKSTEMLLPTFQVKTVKEELQEGIE